MLYQKIKALNPKVNNTSIQNQISNFTVGTHILNIQPKKYQRFQNNTMEIRSQRQNELESIIQYQSLFKRIKESFSQKKENQCLQISNLSVDFLQKSCGKTRSFYTKNWNKVNCDEDSYAGRKFILEKEETKRCSKISPCLRISQAKRFERSNSYLTNLRIEMKKNIQNQNQYPRSRTMRRQNVVFVFLENYLPKNQATKKI